MFYKFNPAADILTRTKAKENSGDYHSYIWKPKGLQIWPKGFLGSMKEMRSAPIVNLVFWWLIYKVARRNSDYSILFLENKNEIIHYTVILPANYRFPFAPKGDLILGPVWTSPHHRKKGLVYLSLSVIIENYKNNARQFWWICNEENMASRISIEKAGFLLFGKGKIMNDNKIKLFSYFEPQSISAEETK